MGELGILLLAPALVGYGEAAVAYVGETVRPGRAAGLAIWGVRLGWLAQTALLVAQAVRADGFPWSTWAGSLNLFVWMCVGGYLIWGCRTRFRLLGLGVMPLAAGLLAVAWVAGGTGTAPRSGFGDAFLVVHVGLVLAAFAAFTLAAALAALYLWQERRLKSRSAGVLRLRAPALVTLDLLTGRTIAVALAGLTIGIGIGFARLETRGGSLDVTMVVTALAWAVYAAYLVLRHQAGWRGRRTAYVALIGFVVVLVVRVGLPPVAHF